MRATTPPGWPVLLACVALIYLPTLLFDALCYLMDRVREIDDRLVLDWGSEDEA